MDDKELHCILFSAVQHHNDSLLDDLLDSENGLRLIDIPGSTGNVLLHVAVLENDLKCVRSLLKHGADPNVFDAARARSPLHLAVELGQTDIVKAFLELEHVNLDLRDDRNLTCYEIAQFCDNQNLANIIHGREEQIEQERNDFYTIMNQACTKNEPRLVKDIVERYERKILKNLPIGSHEYKVKKLYARSIIREMINWSSSSWNDVTLLFKSASKGHTEICRLLIGLGATAKCNENTNYSPLYVAAYGGFTSTVRLLLDSFPCLIKEVTIEKWTVLHACCLQGHSETAKLLLNYAYPDFLKQRFVTRSGLYEYQFAFNLNAQDAAGQTVIYLAVSANNESLLDALLHFNIEAKLIATSDRTEPISLHDKQPINFPSNTKDRSNVIRSSARIITERPRTTKLTLNSMDQDDESNIAKANTSNKIDKIMRQLRKFQFSREASTQDENVGDVDKAKNITEKYLICPFEMDTYCDYNSKTALHLAVCQQYHNIATTLLVNGSNPNLPILFRDPIKSASENQNHLNTDIGLNWLRSSKSTSLKEACRLNDEIMCEILIRYGARDNQDNLALQVAASNKNCGLMSMFLSLKSNVDAEYKINRKCNVEFASRYKQSQKLSKISTGGNTTTTFSSMFPSTPVTIDWQNLKCIQPIDPQWLIDASLAHNRRLRHPTNSLMAITRLDLSANNLKSIHPVVFRLPSLRELNLSNNRLESLIEPNYMFDNKQREFAMPTSKLIESHRTAIKRSKSSHFTGVNLESSNLIDLNEPQEWDLPCLEVLDLHDNLLMSLPDCLFELPKLTELDVSSNQLRQLPWAMWQCASLREMIVSGNLLDDLPRAPPHNTHNATTSSPLETIPDATSEKSFNSTYERNDDKLNSTLTSSLETSTTTNSEPNYLTQILANADKRMQDTCLESHVEQLRHLNHWSKRIDLVNVVQSKSSQDNADSHKDSDVPQGSKLTYLNLSHNSFKTIPPVLACIATELVRLNMSHNRLESLGDISLFPAKIKNLDLSNNLLSDWFQFSQQDDDTKHCFTENYNKLFPIKYQRGHGVLYCVHKLHQRLDHLKSFNLSHNQLKEILIHQAYKDNVGITRKGQRDTNSASPSQTKAHLLYPNITALDLSYNRLQKVSDKLYELKDLSVLNLSGNNQISTLPPELGLITKLWNLGVNGCSLGEPLKSIVEGKSYKTMDIIGYLRSILEEAKPYARMKLMLVGLQGIGKTSLLEQMRHEGSTSSRRRAPEHWTRRMGHTARGNLRNQKGTTLSTVGVDIHDWTYNKRVPRSQHSFGPVTFSTWDFGGQEEFYATHRYFLSRRSMYLVVWRLTDGMRGILGIQQWLVNIQSRAPGSPVIIVGTHEDLVDGGERGVQVLQLQAELTKRFIDVSDHDKCGLPRVMDAIVVSTKTKLNIKMLCNRIYDVVFSLRCPRSTERLLEQKIPATYLYLEEIISSIVHERHQRRREPVLTYDEYKRLVAEHLKVKYNKTFRDLEPINSREINYNSELQQATRFLHENGVLLHYEDSNLRDLYFLDPQWLCDILSHVVTIREINPHVKNGLMRIDDLGFLFKSMDVNVSGGVQSYVVNLLNKFEIALTWNSQYLLIPSLLPANPSALNEEKEFQVKMVPKTRGRSVVRRLEMSAKVGGHRSTSIEPTRANANKLSAGDSSCRPDLTKNFYEFDYTNKNIISRLILLRYLPAGFLARLQSAILSDPIYDDVCEDIQYELINDVSCVVDNNGDSEIELVNLVGARPSWLCWKKGIQLSLSRETTINATNNNNAAFKALEPTLLTVQEYSYDDKHLLLTGEHIYMVDCSHAGDKVDDNEEKETHVESKWFKLDVNQYSNVIEVTIPNPKLKVINKEDRNQVKYYSLSHMSIAKLMSRTSDYIDDLLEDWYPSLGARFAHTLGGNYLVTRIAPCPSCSALVQKHNGTLNRSHDSSVHERVSRRTNERISRGGGINSRVKFSINNQDDCNNKPNDSSPRSPFNPQHSASTADNKIYCFYIEHCIVNAYDLAPLQSSSTKSRMLISLLKQSSDTQTMATAPTNKKRSRNLHCPLHGTITLSNIAPDVVFDDIPEALKIDNEQVDRCKLIGRGALGFVFRASLRCSYPLNQLGQANQEVALKLLQPVDPGPDASQADVAAYASAKQNWSKEPFQCACKSYCTARHEANILLALNHPNIVSFIGLCCRPLALVLELAPLGSLSDVFKNYRRASVRIDQFCVQKTIMQVARALEFLHQQRVIYRDLKTENILVWSYPLPGTSKYQSPANGHVVELKLADYGISRQALSTGIWKGFAGTMSFLAPEILRHNGDEEYTEKVDCFSFGMFMFELLTLRPPYKHMNKHNNNNNMNHDVLNGAKVHSHLFMDASGRPALSYRDLLYPNNMLDLMSLCWSQEPHDRPTASQIVSIASTPEFIQVQDAVTLSNTHSTCGAHADFYCAIEYAREQSIDLWFGLDERCNNQVSYVNVLSSSNQQGFWNDWRKFESGTNKVCRITCMLVVEDTIWLFDSNKMQIHVTNAAPKEMREDHDDHDEEEVLSTSVVDQHGDYNQFVDLQTDDQNNSTLLRTFTFNMLSEDDIESGDEIKSAVYVKHAKCVILLTKAGRLWCCQLNNSLKCVQLEDSSVKFNCLCLSADEEVNSSSNASENELPIVRLFCGQSNGISTLDICDGEIRRQSIWPLASSRTALELSGEPVVEVSSVSSEISHIIALHDILWTSAGCTVHLWDVKEKQVTRKLDCWKLVPCSESLESINIELYYQEARSSQVTSMIHAREQLFVATSHGCVIVIEANSLKPLTVFRPYESDVILIRPIQIGTRRTTNDNTGDTTRHQQELSSNNTQQPSRLIALGLGYRDLMRRYLNSLNNEQTVDADNNNSKSLVAILLTPMSESNI